jgi:hypothetical protein
LNDAAGVDKKRLFPPGFIIAPGQTVDLKSPNI